MNKNCFFYTCLILSILFVFLSCTEDFNITESTKKIDEILLSAPDGISELEKIVKNKKIIFIGSGDHRQINDHNFLNRKNIEKLRTLGVKYIFVEGGGPEIFVFNESDLESDWIRIFYPWHSVDVQYHENDLKKVVLDVNRSLDDEDKIIMVSLEANRENAVPENYDLTDLNNYRDKYMYDVARYFIDNSGDDEKILIYAGAAHGFRKPVNYFSSKKWKTLGSYLDNDYGDCFASYSYVSLSGIFQPWFIGGIKLPGEQIKGKYISSDKIKSLNKVINFIRYDEAGLYDGFFIDKNTEYGLLYGYALSIPSVLDDVLEYTREVDSYCNQINNKYDYTDSEQYYKLDSFVRNIYYIKLFYGDLFDYNFWNPSTKLKDALNKLPLNYEGHKFIDKEKMAEYQNFLFYLMNDLYYIDSKKELKTSYEHWLPFVEKARAIYPEEVWCDYWQAKMNFKLGNYNEAVKFCDSFLNNKLSMSCQVLPEVLEIAVQSCTNMGKDEVKYRKQLKTLSNEHNIEISNISLFL